MSGDASYDHRLYYTVVSHSDITLRSPISIHVRKDIPFYLNESMKYPSVREWCFIV